MKTVSHQKKSSSSKSAFKGCGKIGRVVNCESAKGTKSSQGTGQTKHNVNQGSQGQKFGRSPIGVERDVRSLHKRLVREN